MVGCFGCVPTESDATDSDVEKGVNFSEFPNEIRVFDDASFSWYIYNDDNLSGEVVYQWKFVPDDETKFKSYPASSAGLVKRTSDVFRTTYLSFPKEHFLWGSMHFSSSATVTMSISDIQVPGYLYFDYNISVGSAEYSESKTIRIFDNEKPNVFASYELISTENKQVKLKMESRDADGEISAYIAVFRSEYENWEDSVSFVENEKSFTLPYKGNYTVDYYAIDNENYISDKRSLSFNISQKSPVLAADLRIDDQIVSADNLAGYAPADLSVDLSSSSTGEAQKLQYYIDFGDGEVSYSSSATHNYANEGSYTLTLAVKDDQLDGITVSKTYDVNITTAEAPTVYINSNSSTFHLGDTLYLSANISADEGVEIKSVEWQKSIGDDIFEFLSYENSTSYYCNEFFGTGKIKLIVTDDKGNKVSKVFSFEVENRVPSLQYIKLDEESLGKIKSSDYDPGYDSGQPIEKPNYYYESYNPGIYSFELSGFSHEDAEIVNPNGNFCDYTKFKYTVVFYPESGDEVITEFGETSNPNLSNLDCDQKGLYKVILEIRDSFTKLEYQYISYLRMK